ncbi:MAG: hypothetical protein KKA60_11130 [Proteobacteria bacterium]|nr:hypothetical protein [Pseudomonadota bacterium]
MKTYSVDEELTPANPNTGILKRVKLQRDKRAAVQPMNPEEVALFLGTCGKHRPEHFAFFLCTFRTGMRLGEVLALQ